LQVTQGLGQDRTGALVLFMMFMVVPSRRGRIVLLLSTLLLRDAPSPSVRNRT
jgi:hypothetical protein